MTAKKSKAPANTRTTAKRTSAKKSAPAKQAKAKTAAAATRNVARKTAEPKTPVQQKAVVQPKAVAQPKTVTTQTKAAGKPKTQAVAVPVTPPAAVAVNAKLADIARTNMNAGLDLAFDLASAKSPMEAMRLGLNYWYANVSVFRSQAQDLRKLSADLIAVANEPIRETIRRS